MAIITGKAFVRSGAVRLGGEHILFVEGERDDSIDPKILRELFDNKISVEPLGPSFHIESVAQALFPYHPCYYFLIDRDHYRDDSYIQKCWEDFPDPGKSNLLVWRKKEIENYFLDPEYLSCSTFLNVSKDELERKILDISKKRLFFDVANYVIVSIRSKLKKNWIKIFTNPDDFTDKDSALDLLVNRDEFRQHRSNVSSLISPDKIQNLFNEYLDMMTGGQDEILFGAGKWLEMIAGKKVFSQVINSECFNVQDDSGDYMTGEDGLDAIARDLLRKDENVLPPDFRELRNLIRERVSDKQ